MHLEGHQIQHLSRREVAPQERFKKDTVRLEPNEEAVVFMKFRTFQGRYVFTAVSQQNMAMMGVFNVGRASDT
jgi:FtsP/CotA-like multicopper oxidase with cupredoxin domain